MSANQPRILVTGASGNLGGLVLTHLIQTLGYPVNRVIATSRHPEDLAKWSELGVEVRKADFGDPSSLAQAFEGADKLLLISTDSTDNKVRLESHQNAIHAATQAGVGHVFYTSLPEAETSLVSFASVHSGTEKAIQASGLKWTILRNNWYFENLIPAIQGALATGQMFTAAGDGKIAYIARTDLALAAAAALVSTSDLSGTTFTLTGAEALDVDAVATLVSQALDRPISVVQVPLEAIIEGAKSHGLPEPVAIMIASFDTASKAGDLGAVTSDFEKLTGRAPRPLAEWLTEYRAVLTSQAAS